MQPCAWSCQLRWTFNIRFSFTHTRTQTPTHSMGEAHARHLASVLRFILLLLATSVDYFGAAFFFCTLQCSGVCCTCGLFIAHAHIQTHDRRWLKVFCVCIASFCVLWCSFPFCISARTHTCTHTGAHVGGKIDYEMIYWPQKLLQYWLKLLFLPLDFPRFSSLFVSFIFYPFAAISEARSTRRMRNVCHGIWLPPPTFFLANRLNAFS